MAGCLDIRSAFRYDIGVRPVNNGYRSLLVRAATECKKGSIMSRNAVLCMLAAALCGPAMADDGWISIFNGRDLTGWRANENPGTFSVKDGLLVVDGPRSHLFYVGPVCGANFRNFEWKADVLTFPKANSGMYFHTEYQASGWPGKGYEVQVNTTHSDRKKTGGLYGVADVMDNAPSRDGEWFTQHIIVQDKRIVIKVDGKVTVDYTEPDNVRGPRRLSSGTVAIQGHDPDSVVHFRNIMIKPLDEGCGWIDLFNGKDLDNWIIKFAGHDLGDNYLDTFRVEDGLLKICYDKYERFDNKIGHIFYDQKFSHYLLRVEYRFVGDQAPGGPGWAFRNNGIMLHCQSPESMRKDQEFPVSIEVQLLGGAGSAKRTTGNLCTPGTNVVMDNRLITAHCTNSTSETYHGDQWVTIDIEVRAGEVIRHIIDGKVVLEYEKPQYDERDGDAKRLIPDNGDLIIREDYIALQAESHPTQFRKVRIFPLD